MPLSNHAQLQQYIFVLWGEQFEETAATIFTTQLRAAGLRVKIVGLNGLTSSGVHGLSLRADLTLDQALPLAQRAACVIVPCNYVSMKRIKNDPRVRSFFAKVHANAPRFVVAPDVAAGHATQQEWSLGEAPTIPYPDNETLVTFVQELAGLLIKR